MTYAEHIDQLGRSLAELVGRSDREWSSDPIEATVALAVRDVIGRRLEAMAAAIVHAPTANRLEFPARLVASDPGLALHNALAELPVALPESGGAHSLLFGGSDQDPGPWQHAIRACALLEPYTAALRDLRDHDAWAAIRTVGDLAEGLLSLDIELTNRHGARHVDVGRHGALRIAVEELSASVTPGPHPQIAVPASTGPSRVVGVLDLPNATRRLAAMIDARGEHLTAVEARAAARALTEGLAITTRSCAVYDDADLARALDTARRHSQWLDNSPMATAGTPSPSLRYLAGEIVTHLRAADGILDRLVGDPTSRPAERRAVVEALLPWAREAAAVGAALDRGMRASHRAGWLFAPPTSDAAERLRWMPTRAFSERAEASVLRASRATRQSTAWVGRTIDRRTAGIGGAEPSRSVAIRDGLAVHPARRAPDRRLELSGQKRGRPSWGM